MPSSRSHLFASGVLALGGGLFAVLALAIVVGRVVLDAGLPGVVAKPQDIALIGDLFAVVPFIVTFAAANLAAAVGLATGRTWAPQVARWITGVSVATGLLGLVLLIAGSGPVSVVDAAHGTDPDGFAIVSFFVILYAWAAIAVRLPDDPFRPLGAATAAGSAA
jgi:hypothetical protein